MRAVLRTLVQCQAQCILHRDIKPGNFMLLDEREEAPVKAIGELPLQTQTSNPSVVRNARCCGDVCGTV